MFSSFGLDRRPSREATYAPRSDPLLLKLGRLGLADLLRLVVLRRDAGAGTNLDPARTQGLGDLALQLDGEQPVVDARTRDLHVVSQVEALLEGASGNAAVQDLHTLGLGMFLPVHQERVVLLDELDFLGRIPGDGHGDAVSILASLLDVVGGQLSTRLAWSSMSKS